MNYETYCFADACTAEKSNLSSLRVGGEKIDDLNASHKNFLRLTLLGEERGWSVDGCAKIALNWSCGGARCCQQTLWGLRYRRVELIIDEGAETDTSYLARLRALR